MNSHFLKSTRSSKSQRGFSLVEIIIVLAIIALIVGTAITQLGGILGSSKTVVVEADIGSITSALKMYEITNRMLPTNEQGLKALVDKPAVEPIPKRWSRIAEKELKDPWQHPYVYVYPGKHNPKSFDVYSLGEDGVESEDDIGNWE